MFYNDISIEKQDVTFVQMTLDNLTNDFDAWIKVLKEKSGRKGFELFHPIRMILTGKQSGPELKIIFNFFGVEKVRARIFANLEV